MSVLNDVSHVGHRMAADLGPALMEVFRREDVTELGVNPNSDYVWIDSMAAGKMIQTDVTISKQHVRSFLNRAADYSGQHLTGGRRTIACMLPQEPFAYTRLTGKLPTDVPAPAFCLRKLNAEIIPLERYISDGILTHGQYEVIVRAIREEENIFVVGKTSSGKTILTMSILDKLGELLPDERVFTIEDRAELRLERTWNWFQMTTSDDGNFSPLIHDALSLTPDRIVIAECRGPGLLALFDAALSGHPGCITTFHSDSAALSLRRMYSYCLRSSNTSSHKYTIGDAVDLVIVIKREKKLPYITEMVTIDRYSEKQGGYIGRSVPAGEKLLIT